MKAAKISMTYALLTDFLRLPVGAEIRGIWGDRCKPHLFHFIVQHEDLPEVAEGCVPPRADIIYHTGSDMEPHFEEWSVQE